MGDHNLLRWSGNAMIGRNKKALKRSEIEFAPSIDQLPFYDAPRERSASPLPAEPDLADRSPHDRFTTNSKHKSHPNARFARQGKLYAWGPAYEDVRDREHVRKRMRLCMEQFMPEAATEVDAKLPNNVTEMTKDRDKIIKEEADDKKWRLQHLRSPSPPLSTEELAPMLAIPQTYVDIMMSPSFRHTLGDDSMEQALQRTAGDLLESEKPLLQVLGRLKDTLRLVERDVPPVKVDLDDKSDSITNGRRDLAQLPHISDTDNLWRVTQQMHQPNPRTITYSLTKPGDIALPPNQADIDKIKLTPTQRLFTNPHGMTLIATDIPGTIHSPGEGPGGTPEKYNIDLGNQVIAVDDAMERISELLADCNEYKTRLEEARDRIADVARARKTVWNVIKERAGWELDKYQSKGEEAGAQLL